MKTEAFCLCLPSPQFVKIISKGGDSSRQKLLVVCQYAFAPSLVKGEDRAPASLEGSVATQLNSVQWVVSRKNAAILLEKQEGSPFPPSHWLRWTQAATLHTEAKGRLG